MWNRLTPVVKNLLIINIICFLADFVFQSTGINLSGIFGLYSWGSSNFHIWQFVTYMFMHGSFGHLFCNMLAVWMFGVALEEMWDSKRFLIYYIITGIGAGIIQELVWMLTGQAYGITIGASGAVFGILLAYAWLFPESRMFIFPIPVPIRARVLVIVYAIFELFTGLGPTSDGIAHFAHLGGMLFGLGLILLWKKKGVQNMESGDFDSGLWKSYWEKFKKKTNDFLNSHRNEDSKNPHSGFHYQEPTRENNQKTTENSQRNSQNTQENDTEKAKNDAEINRILDKIKLSGYDSLTEEERNKLFKR